MGRLVSVIKQMLRGWQRGNNTHETVWRWEQRRKEERQEGDRREVEIN